MQGRSSSTLERGTSATPVPADRVILLMGPATYRSSAFLVAAERLKLDVVQGLDLPDALAEHWHVPLAVDLTNPEAAAERIAEYVAAHPAAAIIAVDDSATLAAATASARLGLPHNDPASALAARDKLLMRQRLAAAGVPVPWFRAYPAAADPATIAAEIDFPCVVKPLRLSGSRGVIRANDPASFVAAFARTRRMLVEDGHPPEETSLLVERYLPGVEIALEGLLTNGSLCLLALFDKPDPLDGPFFEETIYVTPSRLPEKTQQAIGHATAQAAAALGLREGPVHAELRINDDGIWPIELAGRSIGGLCSTILEFGAGMTLEEIILRHAVGRPLPAIERSGGAAGVMMIPIPKRGIIKAVDGQDEACQVPGVTGLEITAKLNYPIIPLPEGASYLGFIFARGETPEDVEESLREAHARLDIRIDPMIELAAVSGQDSLFGRGDS